MKERIQKILSARGIASRRQAEEMIIAGRVYCNDRVCVLGDAADPECDVITLDGKIIPSNQKKVYLMLNKPRGYVTTLSDEKSRKTAAELVANCGVRVYPVGRLDMDSEGLLLFTNDGEFANLLMHPRHQVKKKYLVTVREYSEKALSLVRRAIVLDGYQIKKPDVKLIGNTSAVDGKARLEITIHEGRNRQVRRMCAEAGMSVVRLVRIAEGLLELGKLKTGAWRYLTEDEVDRLKNNLQ